MQRIKESEQHFIQYDRKEKEFLETGSSPNEKRILALLDSLDILHSQITDNEAFKRTASAGLFPRIGNYLSDYRKAFRALAETYKKRGFYNHGLEVEMRKYIHELQEAVSAEEKVYAYMLRRNEKDFMLRSDEKYIHEFRSNIENFKKLIQTSSLPHMTPEYRAQTIEKIDAYETLFLKLAELEKEIGLSENEGLKGKLKYNFDKILPLLNLSYREISQIYNRYINRTYTFLLTGIILLLVSGAVFSLLLPRILTRPVSALDSVIRQVASGNYEEISKLKRLSHHTETGRLALNFIHLIKVIKSQFAELEDRKRFLEQKAEDDKKRSWVNAGLSAIGQLTNLNDSLPSILDKALLQTVKYTQANQGAIFIIQSEKTNEVFLEMMSCYAYNRKKYFRKKINPGEGLAGTAWLEKEIIQLTEIPKDYLHITSGLGDAPPSYIIIIPMIHNDSVQGVLELAYFNKLNEYETEFLKGVAERLAAAIASLRAHHLTRKLLEESKIMTEQLRAQEEEMRQNMEELMATQEEMQRKVNEYEKIIGKLRESLRLIEEWSAYRKKFFIVADENGVVQYISEKLQRKLSDWSENNDKCCLSNILPFVEMAELSEKTSTILVTDSGKQGIRYRSFRKKAENKILYFFEIETEDKMILIQ